MIAGVLIAWIIAHCVAEPGKKVKVCFGFMEYTKGQLIHHCTFQSVTEAEQALFHYIEIYYNRQRKHSTNGYKSPAQYELEWWNNRKAA